nr:MAG TPA: hypothetical protein [Caudoviricetes sp.]
MRIAQNDRNDYQHCNLRCYGGFCSGRILHCAYRTASAEKGKSRVHGDGRT